jgi:hypothetical protein
MYLTSLSSIVDTCPPIYKRRRQVRQTGGRGAIHTAKAHGPSETAEDAAGDTWWGPTWGEHR